MAMTKLSRLSIGDSEYRVLPGRVIWVMARGPVRLRSAVGVFECESDEIEGVRDLRLGVWREGGETPDLSVPQEGCRIRQRHAVR